MLRSFALTFVITNLLITNAFGQRETVTQSAEWFTLSSNIKMSKRVSVLAEGQFRYVGSLQPMQFQARTGVDIFVTKHWSVMPVGYVYTWNPIYGEQPALYSNNEHRIFEQATFRHQVGRVFISHRGRLEQRFLQVHESDNGEVISNGYQLYLNRFRYRISVQVPINHSNLEPKTLFASAYNELFVDFGGATIYTDPDQNRFFTGLGYQVSNRMNFQGGFFYQKLIKLSGTKQENNVGFQIQLTYNIDLTRSANPPGGN